jgi:aryl-alcohol dehydrogenase-like predicted oxidoreductase
MELRKLGRSSLLVSPLALGGNVFGWTVRDDHAAFRILDAYVAAGGNLIDTADSYSRWAAGNQGGESESMIGRWLLSRKDRYDLVLATKVGADVGQGKKDLSSRHILKSVEDSLKRLNTDYIDLYQAHFDDPDTRMEETLEAFGSLISSGKVRVIGASNFSARRLEQALNLAESGKYPRYESLQPRYNLYDRADFERDLEPVCAEKRLGVITYYSLASGFLSGKYRQKEDLNKSDRGDGISRFLDSRGMKILGALDEVSAKYRCNPASVALAWLVARPAVTAAIASATQPRQLEELLFGVNLKLDEESMELLNNASAGE